MKISDLFVFSKQYLEESYPGDSAVKNPLVMQEMWARSLCWDDPLKREMTTQYNILA